MKYLVCETSGIGQLLVPIIAYTNKDHAKQHIDMALKLMPIAANKLIIKEIEVKDEF